ncbi:MAG: tryptophan--tRNA ligase [Clostridiales bacterium]|nr:tryptophan--tRNA ligase [Clostridiales bacterium]
MSDKKTILSLMQPSGDATLGNYLGALKNWQKLEDEFNCIYAIADLHTLTVRQDPAQLRKNSMQVLALFLAMGLNKGDNIVFAQSHVSAHAELGWVLDCFTYTGELSRMTQFKDKSARHADNINAGLFTYPCLMAADILLYQADMVPVGEDQRQHLEITRDIAERFNNIYGDVFKVPEAYIGKAGARVMGLQEPTRKMSKSESANANNVILLNDDLNQIANKIKRAVTDSDSVVKASPDKPGITNLLSIYCAVTGKTLEEAEGEFVGVGYGAFKAAVAEAVVEELRPVKEEYERILKDKAYINSVIKDGAERAGRIAYKTLAKVYKKVGLIPPVR